MTKQKETERYKTKQTRRKVREQSETIQNKTRQTKQNLAKWNAEIIENDETKRKEVK